VEDVPESLFLDPISGAELLGVKVECINKKKATLSSNSIISFRCFNSTRYGTIERQGHSHSPLASGDPFLPKVQHHNKKK